MTPNNVDAFPRTSPDPGRTDHHEDVPAPRIGRRAQAIRFRMNGCWTTVNGPAFELLQPVTGPNAYLEHEGSGESAESSCPGTEPLAS